MSAPRGIRGCGTAGRGRGSERRERGFQAKLGACREGASGRKELSSPLYTLFEVTASYTSKTLGPSLDLAEWSEPNILTGSESIYFFYFE